MKWSFASVGLIMLGLFGIVIIMLFNDITVSNEQDYYTLKYATEASMLEAVDVAYYRLTGYIKISKEKFVENFTRRFTETSTFGQGNYGIDFYQINEYPAKVSLRIYDKTSGYNIYTYNSDVETTQPNIINELSAILDGESIDDGKNGYEIIGNNSQYFGRRGNTNNECEIKIVVGRHSTTGEDIFRCVYTDGSEGYQDISGSVVTEGNIDFDTAASEDTNSVLYTESAVAVGTIKGTNNEIAYEYTNYKGEKKYTDKNSEVTLAASNIDFFSKNKDNCDTRVPIGTKVGTNLVVYRCNLGNSNYEYQDGIGHLVSAGNVNFYSTKNKCEAQSIVGLNKKTGEIVFRCNSTSGVKYQDISGNTVNEKDIEKW